MGETAIEWTDFSWNPIRAKNRKTGVIGWHCTHVSDGCRICYAEGFNKRLGTGLEYKPGHEAAISIFLDPVMVEKPLHWKKPRKIFVCSMTDLFADFVKADWIRAMFDVMVRTPHHTYQVLTKRPARMFDQMHEMWDVPPPNVWLGVSVEDQAAADDRIPLLLRTPAAKRFLSCEPLLGPMDISPWLWGRSGDEVCSDCPKDADCICGMQTRRTMALPTIDWVICGGESGKGARPMHPDGPRQLRDQCKSAAVPFFFKQWGEHEPAEFDSAGQQGEAWRKTPSGRRFWLVYELGKRPPEIDEIHFSAVGKKRAGRLLDGREHNGMPV